MFRGLGIPKSMVVETLEVYYDPIDVPCVLKICSEIPYLLLLVVICTFLFLPVTVQETSLIYCTKTSLQRANFLSYCFSSMVSLFSISIISVPCYFILYLVFVNSKILRVTGFFSFPL